MMNVYKACSIGYDNGLETVGESIYYIKTHATEIFGSDNNKLNKEMDELYIDGSKYDPATRISSILHK